MEIVSQQLQATRLNESRRSDKLSCVTGPIRINPKSFSDAFITDKEGGPDIYIDGSNARADALEGDIVEVQINPKSQWKLNLNIVAAKWDEWSQYLLPIVEKLEAEAETKKSNSAEDLINGSVDQHAKVLEGNSDNSDTNLVQQKLLLKPPQQETSQNNGHATNNKTRSPRRKRCVTETPKTKDKVSPKANKIPSNLPAGISKLQVAHVIDLPLSSLCIQKTGRVVRVVRRNHPGLAGGLLKKYSDQAALFSPIDPRIPRMLIQIDECPLDFRSQPERYQDILFIARMYAWDGNKNLAMGNLVKIVGDSNSILSRMETLLIEHQIHDYEFPSEAYAELEYLNYLPPNWVQENSFNRRDLTHECILTIDPKTARDLDDAVSIRQLSNDVFEVGVHIADVSYFVREQTAVNYYAKLRTTSVYLVDRVIPMLPRPLCEHVCSLNPGEPKLTFSVIWQMNSKGEILNQWFGRTVIRTSARLAYEQAQDLIDKKDDVSWIIEDVNMPKLHSYNWAYISKCVNRLHMIAQNLRSRRFEDGALRIDQVKIKFELDPESGHPTGFTFEQRLSSSYLIEEFMLLANMSVAKKIYTHNPQLAFLRRHPPSSPSILKEVKEFCDATGWPLDITSSGSIQKSLLEITDPTISKVVSFLLLRAMKNAEYICCGAINQDEYGFRHFALNVPFYTHFTSPIRRYADIIVHRQLAAALGIDQYPMEDLDTMALIAEECTKRKISSKLISEASQKMYFNLFVSKAGFCELLACVTRIYDQSFDVILVDYNQIGRVYLDQIKPYLNDFKFESISGIKRLVLDWKPLSEKKSKKNKKKLNFSSTDDQLNCRQHLETNKSFSNGIGLRVNEAVHDRQIIQVFDVIRVVVTVDEKDITKLRVNLKKPA